MRVYHVTNRGDIHPEVLVHEDISESADLRPGDLGMRVGELVREVVRCLADDLEIPFDGILCHVDEVRIVAVESVDVLLAAFDRLQDVSDALFDAAAHRATASVSADSEIGRLRSWTGKMSMSSRPNN